MAGNSEQSQCEERAAVARVALNAYRDVATSRTDIDDDQTVLNDLVTDLAHMAAQDDLSFEFAVRMVPFQLEQER